MNAGRQKEILEILLKEKTVNVKDLAGRLYISEPSIRRDLKELENKKLLKRVHGGAVLGDRGNSKDIIPFIVRELEQSGAKIFMAEKAASLIKDGDVIMLDASSSAYNIIPFLKDMTNLTVITSGLKALIKLSEYGINAYSTGGHLLDSALSLTGEDAANTIKKYNADLFFFSCRGLSFDGRLTDFSIDEDLVRQKMIKAAKKSVLLCGSEKLGKVYVHNLCNVSDIYGVICEEELPENLCGI